MKKALLALNSIKKSGVIDDYAIGGAIAASFYIEAINTEDVDVFLFMSATEDSILLSLNPIYDALKQLGGKVEKEYIVIGDWPIQILPAYSPLVEEAVKQEVIVKYGDIETRIFSAVPDA
jgi:tetrahydromethanopterin S-methyltransferase subunit A